MNKLTCLELKHIPGIVVIPVWIELYSEILGYLEKLP